MKLTHPLLTKIAAEVSNNVPQQLRSALDDAVGAGNEVMWSKQGGKMIKNQMGQGGDVSEMAGEGVAKLVGIIWKQSDGKMPLRVMIPAGIILTCHALEFLMDAGVLEDITNAEADSAIQEFASTFLQLIGVTPERLQQMLAEGAAKAEAGQSQQPQQAGIIAGQAQGGM